MPLGHPRTIVPSAFLTRETNLFSHDKFLRTPLVDTYSVVSRRGLGTENSKEPFQPKKSADSNRA